MLFEFAYTAVVVAKFVQLRFMVTYIIRITAGFHAYINIDFPKNMCQ